VIQIGTDFACGCRTSGGNYYPCPYHENMLCADLEKMDNDGEYLNFVVNKNREIWKARRIFKGEKRTRHYCQG
jgi:hypothetical protein